MKYFPIPDFEPWCGAYGTPSFWRWRAELVDGYHTLKKSRSHLYVAHKSPDPVLFVLDMLLFCLPNTFWLCSVHGMLMLSLINEITAPKQVVGVSRQVCDSTKTSIAYVSSVCTCLNQVWVLCAYCALTCCDIMQNDAIWARWVRLQAILNPESDILDTVYPERWTDSELIRLFSSDKVTTCSEVELDKLGRDCQATVELDTRILKCVEALKDQGWFSDETQGVTLKENPVANASVAGTCRDLRHIEAAHVVWLHSCIVQCSHAAIAAVPSETQGEISPAKSGAASIATKEAGECVCQRAGYPYEKLLCMHQISFHIVRALKFLMSAADHQHLCLRQFHSALIAQTQNGTAQKYDTAIFPVAAAKKQLLLRLEYIVNNYAVHTAFVARVFKSVHAWGHTLAQTEIKGREVETHSDAASTMPTAGSHLPTLGAAPAYQITTSDLTSYPKPMDTSDTGVYGAYVLDTYMENWHICMVFLIHSV